MKKLFTIPARFHGNEGVVTAWHPDGSLIATTGTNRLVFIFDRYGERVDEIKIPAGGACIGLDWDKDGEVLGILMAASSIVYLWDLNSKKLMEMDSNMKDLSWLKWSLSSSQLAVGTAKGNLLIYNRKTSKKNPIMGKHTKGICCGAWNSDNKLALGAKDKEVTVSDADGNTLCQASLKQEPLEIRFFNTKTDDRGRAADQTVSANLSGRTIYMFTLSDPENPVELAFQKEYGTVITHKWFGDGYMMLGFSNGYVVVISTHVQEIGEELFCHRLFEGLVDLDINFAMQKAAAIGDGMVKILDMGAWKEISSEKVEMDASDRLAAVKWAGDGQILTVTTVTGAVHNYLGRLAILNAAYNTSIVSMSSLRQLSISDAFATKMPTQIDIAIEPSFVALGPKHVAVGMNNYAWFYSTESTSRVLEKEYMGTIESMSLNAEYAAVQCEGHLQLHPINERAGLNSANFPDKEGPADVTTSALAGNFLIYGLKSGSVHYFYLNDWVQVNEFKHDVGIRLIFPNSKGTRSVFIDENHTGNLYNPVNDQIREIPDFSSTVSQVFWDCADPNVFIAVDGVSFSIFVFAHTTVAGPTVTHIGQSAVATGSIPILLHNGTVVSQQKGGEVSKTVLDTHHNLVVKKPGTEDLALEAALSLLRFDDAWDICKQINSPKSWETLSVAALHHLDIELAIRGYRKLQNAAMVMSLQKLVCVEDKNLLAGYVALMNKDYNNAENLFWKSSRPITALEMRQDLLQWEQALRLASLLDNSQVANISRAYAQQLEHQGEYSSALQMYQNGACQASNSDDERLCQNGIVRMTIRSGDTATGLSLALQSEDKQLMQECATILEGMKQLNDAATLYERSEMYEKAAHIFIHTKNFSAAGRLMDFIKAPKLLIAYAKAKESEGNYKEAVKAYKKAKEMDAVARLLLEKLNQPQEAFAIVRETQSVESALMCANYCAQIGDFKSAIEFLLIAKQGDKAFELAQTHDAMSEYARQLGDKGTTEEYTAIAKYYESKGMVGEAGNFYARCGNSKRAVDSYLMSGTDEHIQAAIDVVGKANDEALTSELIDYLVGERDGKPKEPNHIFKLYMALGSYTQAAHTAVIIARQEQDRGNYKLAHRVLFETHEALSSHGIKVQQDLAKSLLILHSYILVKVCVKQGDHLSGAKMLIRVAKHISKFPSHIVPILTSTVIECQRSGLKKNAYEYASMLMRPEYRSQIASQYKRKIEMLVRKRPDMTEEEEPTSPCPFCNTMIPQTCLDCPSCSAVIPYCIATGRHMVLDEWSMCPHCKFPALFTPFKSLLEHEPICPMCAKEVSPTVLSFATNPKEELEKLAYGSAGGE